MVSALRAIRPAHRVMGLGQGTGIIGKFARVLDRSLHGSVTSEKVFTIDDHPRASTADPNALTRSNGVSVRRREIIRPPLLMGWPPGRLRRRPTH